MYHTVFHTHDFWSPGVNFTLYVYPSDVLGVEKLFIGKEQPDCRFARLKDDSPPAKHQKRGHQHADQMQHVHGSLKKYFTPTQVCLNRAVCTDHGDVRNHTDEEDKHLTDYHCHYGAVEATLEL